jgi:Cdc6-like AAA superfamily ATPase
MEPKIKDYLDSMENTVKHLQSIGATSRANQATSTKLIELGLRDRDQEKDGAEKALFPVETLPHYPRDCFVGREKEIENIRQRLSSTDPDRLRTYLIYGRRGIGKTQIALEYCERYRKDYDAIFWVRCETSASLRQSFADIAVALELDGADKNGHFEENLMKVLGWLKRTRKNWLLVYDNAERETLLKGYWPVGARGSILLTSRSFHNFFEDDKRYGETVPFFKENERWDLLMALLGEKWQKEHLEESDMLVPLERVAAETLLERTKGLPLAITHAAKLVVNPKISRHKDIPDTSVRGFLELFNEAHKTLSPRPTGDRRQEFYALDTIWSIAFTALSPNARAILGVLALLSPDVTLVDLFLPSDQNRLTEKLAFCRTGSGDPSNRPKHQAAMQPSAALLYAIDELNKAAFISKAGREMRIHREVQEAVNYQGSKDLTDSFNAAVNLMYDAFPKQELGRPLTDQWDSCRRWVQECIHLANKYWLYKDKSRIPLDDQPWADLFAELLSNCAW